MENSSTLGTFSTFFVVILATTVYCWSLVGFSFDPLLTFEASLSALGLLFCVTGWWVHSQRGKRRTFVRA